MTKSLRWMRTLIFAITVIGALAVFCVPLLTAPACSDGQAPGQDGKCSVPQTKESSQTKAPKSKTVSVPDSSKKGPETGTRSFSFRQGYRYRVRRR